MPASPLSCVPSFPHEVRIRIVVIVLVLIATVVLVRHGYEAGSALAVITLAGGTALDLARRLLAPASQPSRGRRRAAAGE
ncbi:hypothetical protein ACFC0D_34155 [Streptomyces sp. NPDC056222]|uniref:hypothetical protein n=1 Tax=Streptomyces sp. NPDC056222 TaxID=3345749 RepID=UPI0035D953C4